jgi:hypothetical protein
MTLLTENRPARDMSTTPAVTPMGRLRDAANSSALIVLIGLLVMTWIYLVIIWPVGLFYSGDEYAYLSLAHAMNLEVRLRDGLMFPDSGLGNHPGVPLYLVSWVCLRVVALLTGHRDAVAYALAEPDAFYLATRVAAGLIALASVLGAYRLLAPLDPWKRAIAIFAFFAADTWSLIYGLTSLGNETFAFPLAVLFFWCVGKIASSPRDVLSPWVYLGAVAAAGYLVKPTYLSILAGGLALACAVAVRYPAPTGPKLRFLGKRILIILGSFVALWAAVLLVIDGRIGFFELIKVHTDFITHTGLIGGGPGRSFSLEPIRIAIGHLMATPLPFVMVAAIGSLAVIFYMQWRSRALDDRSWLWYVAAVVPVTLAALAVLSHFRAHYYVPAITCFLPFIMKPIMGRRGFAAVATICIFAAGAVTVQALADMPPLHKRAAENMKADEATIDALPLDQGEARLWTYGLAGKVFVREFVLQLGGLQSYVHARERADESKDISSYAYVERPYRYIIFARGSYGRTLEELKDNAAHNRLMQPNGMMVTIGADATYRLLLATVVVEIPKADVKN